MAKECRTISHEALYILTELIPKNNKAEEIATLCNKTTGRYKQKYQIDKEENLRNWLHPEGIFSVDTKDDGEKRLWYNFTDGSKSQQGVGSGVAVFTGTVLQ